MATNTAWATSLLDEAAAIVEAEWMRLQQDEALWERELADLARRDACAPARPAPRRRHHHRASVVRPTDARGPSRVADAAMAPNAGMGYPAVSSVRTGCPAERHCRTREVMPPSMITSRQRLSCRPQ